MKICIIGLGSIGKRHLHNLHELAQRESFSLTIDALRSTSTPLSQADAQLLRKECHLYHELDHDYDATFICSPTFEHANQLLQMIDRSQYFFIEKPIFNKIHTQLDSRILAKNDQIYVACPLRYTAVFDALQQYVHTHEIFSARAICSSYLADWRKNVDYRTIYSAKQSLSGGIALDLIHEWDYLSILFGYPLEHVHMSEHVSNLEIDSKDIFASIARYSQYLVEVHLDYFSRKSERTLTLISPNETIEADFLHNKMTYYRKNDIETINFKEEANDKYRKELAFFLDLCKGYTNQNPNALMDACRLLAFVLS